MRRMSLAPQMILAAETLRDAVDALRFSSPITHVYNPLRYAWRPHQQYLQRFASNRKRVVFLGMNPGPWGMSQTGVPFGEIAAVKNWMNLQDTVDAPVPEHPKRPVLGFACDKSEVSGRRLWGLFADRFGAAESFFEEHLVLNYCPLVFMEESSRNFTPDKLPQSDAAALFAACDAHLRSCIEILQPDWVVGIGGFAQKRAATSLAHLEVQHAKVLHPSPASPAANRGWAIAATKQLIAQGVWE